MGSVSLDDIQGDTEIFEIHWNHTDKPSGPGPSQTQGSAAPAETTPTGPRLSLQSRGKEIVLGAKRPAVTLRSGKERAPREN